MIWIKQTWSNRKLSFNYLLLVWLNLIVLLVLLHVLVLVRSYQVLDIRYCFQLLFLSLESFCFFSFKLDKRVEPCLLQFAFKRFSFLYQVWTCLLSNEKQPLINFNFKQKTYNRLNKTFSFFFTCIYSKLSFVKKIIIINTDCN